MLRPLVAAGFLFPGVQHHRAVPERGRIPPVVGLDLIGVHSAEGLAGAGSPEGVPALADLALPRGKGIRP